MWASLSLYGKLLSVQVRSQMQYRVSFLLDVVTSGLAALTGFLTLALVLEKFDQIGGWNLGEVAFLYGMVEVAFGVMDLVFSGFDPQAFGMQVRRGFFDQHLLRPASILVQVLGSRLVLRRLGRIVQGLFILGIALARVEATWTVGKVLFLPVVFASLVSFFGGLFIFGAAITFWTVESIEVINIFTYGGTEMMAYPMHIYPDWMRRFFTYILPAIFLIYYPALYFLGKPDPFGLPPFASFLAPLAGFSVLAAGLVFWSFGLRHYQGTGT